MSLNMQMKTIYRTVGASLVWATLIAKFYVEATNGKHVDIAATTLHYVSFLTMLTNLLVALAFTVPLMKRGKSPLNFFNRPATRAAIALYILVVAIVHHILLADLNEREGLSAITNALLHTVLPALYVLDWLIFAPKRPITYTRIPYWLIFPAGYALFAIMKGAVTTSYPYPFLNVDELGLGVVAMNVVGFTVLFSIGAALFITLCKILPEPVANGVAKTRVLDEG